MIQCLIIEDEVYAANNLEYLIKNSKFDIAIVAKLGSVKESINWLSENKADLIFLDVHLSDGNSFSIFEELQITTPIIFTTTFSSYAIDAFKLNTLGYLLKPIDQQDLNAALLKFTTLNTTRKKAVSVDDGFQRTFVIEGGAQLYRFNDTDISFVFVKNKHVFIQLISGVQVGYDFSLEHIEQRLDPQIFFRINRQFIVSKTCIVKMHNESRGRVRLETRPQTNQNTTVSVERASEFKAWLNL